ncbi:Gfo/Idh/MocA family protein, partial [Gemmatimonadota bacterium]
GVGGRGTRLAEFLVQRNDIEIAYICDVDTRRYAWTLEVLDSFDAPRPKMVQDFRRILDDKAVDALVIATQDHWHALGSVLACQAGKDVYVEKPLAVNIDEGRKMIEAARKYKRIVQVGTQTRSAPYVEKAREYIQSGKLGDVHMVRVCNMMKHHPSPKRPEQPVPEGFDWDFWCGPAPLYPYSPGRWWAGRWDFYCGPIAGDAIHQLDLARMIVGLDYPKSVHQAGGIYHLKDGREIPDTQLATFEYDNLDLILEAGLWMPYHKKIPNTIRDSDRFPDWPFCSTHVEILGTEAMMYFGRQGGGWQVYDINNSEPVAQMYGRQADHQHLENFVNSVRDRSHPVADVEQGHISTALAHLANISYRVGNRKLLFDSQSETFTNCDEANKYLKRTYREPWVMPDEV